MPVLGAGSDPVRPCGASEMTVSGISLMPWSPMSRNCHVVVEGKRNGKSGKEYHSFLKCGPGLTGRRGLNGKETLMMDHLHDPVRHSRYGTVDIPGQA